MWNYEKKVKFLFSKTTLSFFYELKYILHILHSLCLTQGNLSLAFSYKRLAPSFPKTPH